MKLADREAMRGGDGAKLIAIGLAGSEPVRPGELLRREMDTVVARRDDKTAQRRRARLLLKVVASSGGAKCQGAVPIGGGGRQAVSRCRL